MTLFLGRISETKSDHTDRVQDARVTAGECEVLED